jgi:chromosome segregation ATPase
MINTITKSQVSELQALVDLLGAISSGGPDARAKLQELSEAFSSADSRLKLAEDAERRAVQAQADAESNVAAMRAEADEQCRRAGEACALAQAAQSELSAKRHEIAQRELDLEAARSKLVEDQRQLEASLESLEARAASLSAAAAQMQDERDAAVDAARAAQATAELVKVEYEAKLAALKAAVGG